MPSNPLGWAANEVFHPWQRRRASSTKSVSTFPIMRPKADLLDRRGSLQQNVHEFRSGRLLRGSDIPIIRKPVQYAFASVIEWLQERPLEHIDPLLEWETRAPVKRRLLNVYQTQTDPFADFTGYSYHLEVQKMSLDPAITVRPCASGELDGAPPASGERTCVCSVTVASKLEAVEVKPVSF